MKIGPEDPTVRELKAGCGVEVYRGGCWAALESKDGKWAGVDWAAGVEVGICSGWARVLITGVVWADVGVVGSTDVFAYWVTVDWVVVLTGIICGVISGESSRKLYFGVEVG
ncbi:hypothetical protein Tco_1323997 [Tanacetum coccineum]